MRVRTGPRSRLLLVPVFFIRAICLRTCSPCSSRAKKAPRTRLARIMLPEALVHIPSRRRQAESRQKRPGNAEKRLRQGLLEFRGSRRNGRGRRFFNRVSAKVYRPPIYYVRYVVRPEVTVALQFVTRILLLCWREKYFHLVNRRARDLNIQIRLYLSDPFARCFFIFILNNLIAIRILRHTLWR